MLDKLKRGELAKYVTSVVLSYIRFDKQCDCVSTETGGYYADILAYKGSELTEVEVKVDKNDFEADFKKIKHHYYKKGDKGDTHNIVPDKFYFAVPEEMEDYCLSRINQECPSYGLIVIYPPRKTRWGWVRDVRTRKQCRGLRKDSGKDLKITEANKLQVIRRTASQLCSLLAKQQDAILDGYEEGNEHVRTKGKGSKLP